MKIDVNKQSKVVALWFCNQENPQEDLPPNIEKEIEVVSGDGNDLKISPVYEHIKFDNTQEETEKKKKEIVIPKGKNSNK